MFHSARALSVAQSAVMSRRSLTFGAAAALSTFGAAHPQRHWQRRHLAHTPHTGGSEGSHPASALPENRFTQSTPNFSQTSVQNVDSAAEAFAADIVTAPAVDVDFVKDVHGPWLVMTEDLQGELFVDHDSFVFYRPANGLGYGIGKLNVISAGPAGTAFSMELETYTYQPTDAIVAQFGLRYNMTGMVKKVTSKSANYETFSLVGFWKCDNRNVTPAEEAAAAAGKKSADTSVASTAAQPVTSGTFNAAKLTPWDTQTANQHWSPNAELQNVFNHVFPQKLHLTSHTHRLEEAKKAQPHQTSKKASSSSFTGGNGGAARPLHLDLAPFAVGTIPGIYYIPDYISKEEENAIVQRIRDTPPELKSPLKKRTVQEWGGTMCEECQQSFVADANMPPWVQQCTDMLTFDGLFTPTTFPNSVRIHEYKVGEGIGPHCDGPIYVPVVTVLSLASTVVMSFYPRQDPYVTHPMDHYNDTFKFAEGEIGQKVPVQSVVLEPRSLLVFSGDAYHFYPHGVSDKEVDDLAPEVAGEVVNRALLHDKDVQSVRRAYRASITTRNLLTRCNHQSARAEYAMKRAWYLYQQQPVPDELFTPSPVAVIDGASTEVASPPTPLAGEPMRDVPSSSPQSGPLSAADVRRWEAKLDRLFVQQDDLRKSVDDLTQALALALNNETTFRKEMSTVLNHVSSTVLSLDAKVEDLNDAVNDLSSPPSS